VRFAVVIAWDDVRVMDVKHPGGLGCAFMEGLRGADHEISEESIVVSARTLTLGGEKIHDLVP
jgi:hypothetical protein